MKNRKMIKLAGSVVAMAVVCCLANGANANAATVTWKGGAEGHTYDWNTAANWDTGTVPTAKDDVIIDYNNINTPMLSSDISVRSIKSTGYSNETLSFGAEIATALNTTGTNVKVSVSNSLEYIRFNAYGDGNTITVVPTGDATFKSVEFGANVALDVNNKTLSLDKFKIGGNSVGPTKVTGTGTINMSDTVDYKLSSIDADAESLKGTVNVNDMYLDIHSVNAFGKAIVNNNNSQINFALSDADDGKEISNAFSITGSKGLISGSLSFSKEDQTSKDLSIKMPNITLNSDTKFTTSGIAVDMTGIKQNNYCVSAMPQDLLNDGYKWFIGVASGCHIDANGSVSDNDANDNKKYPGVPATAMGWMAKNPIVVAIAGLATAGAVVLLVKKKVVGNK